MDSIHYSSKFVTNSEIEERDNYISSVNSYNIFLNLNKENYSGRVKINIDFNEDVLKKINEDNCLLIDY